MTRVLKRSPWSPKGEQSVLWVAASAGIIITGVTLLKRRVDSRWAAAFDRVTVKEAMTQKSLRITGPGLLLSKSGPGFSFLGSNA